MAVINGQVELVKEFLSNSLSKSKVDFKRIEVTETKHSLLFLLILHCPGIHPRSLLQRTDTIQEAINSTDSKGNTVLMALAIKDSRTTIRRILLNKTATCILDFSITNIYGKNLLHLLVQNNDTHSINMLLNVLKDPREIINCIDCSQASPLTIAYSRGFHQVADCIANHPIQKSLVDWSLKDNKGRSLSEQAEEAKKKICIKKNIKLDFVQVNHKATKRNFPKGGKVEVKEKQAKVDQSKVPPISIHTNGTTNSRHMTDDVEMEETSEELS